MPKTTVGNLSWRYATLREDIDATRFDSVSVKLPEGTLVRYYEGTFDVVDLEGKTFKLKSPNDAGMVMIETKPDAKSRFWWAYPDQPQFVALLESKDYADTAAEREKHLFGAKLPLNEPWWRNDIVEAAMHDQLDKLAVDPPKINANGGPEKAGLPTWAIVALGIGAALLVTGFLADSDEDKPKDKPKQD
jgi:hypothetical protein